MNNKKTTYQPMEQEAVSNSTASFHKRMEAWNVMLRETNKGTDKPDEQKGESRE